MKKIRVPHIMCTNLYRGYGYSGPFCENMTAMVTWLKGHEEDRLCLVAEPDDICRRCPNLTDEGYCMDASNHVQTKDRALLEPLHLVEGQVYTYGQLKEHARKYLSGELFQTSCSNCEWYRQGLCHYEDFDFS